MANDLVPSPSLLADFPGAPFSQDAVDAAVEYVRDQAGWHIAPVHSETFSVEAQGGRYLFLPTRQLVSISAIRHITNYSGNYQMLTDWYPNQTPQFKSGQVTRMWWYWPWYGFIEVDATHGYASCPADLLPVIAAVAFDFSRGRPVGQVAQESVGSVSIGYNTGSLASFDSFGKYALIGI